MPRVLGAARPFAVLGGPALDGARSAGQKAVLRRLMPQVGLPEGAGDAYIADEYKGKTFSVDVEGAKALLAEAGQPA